MASSALTYSAVALLRVLLVLAVMGPTALVGVLAWRSHEQVMSNSRDALLRVRDVIREHTVKVLETHQLAASQVEILLRGLTDDDVRAHEGRLNRDLKQMVDGLSQVQDIWVLNAQGRPLVTGNVYPLPPNLDLSDRGYFRAVRDRQTSAEGFYVSEVLKGRAQDVSFFQIARQRTPDAKTFDGVIAISVQPDYFRDFYAEVARREIDSVALLRADGAVLARHPAPGGVDVRLPPNSAFAVALRANASAGIYESSSSIDGIARYVAYQKVGEFPIYVAVGKRIDVAQATWRAELYRLIAIALPAILGLVALVVTALRLAKSQDAALAGLRLEVARREQIETQLRQSQKMDAIGRLTGGIAHDFNNLLTIVIGNLETIRRRVKSDDERISRSIDHALAGSQRAATLTQRLLAFSRQQPLQPTIIDPNRLVADMSELLRRTLGENVEIETVLAGGVWRCEVDENQLENALLNLAVNARDAMSDGGRLTLETVNAALDDAYVSRQPGLLPGQYVMVAVTDTGSGIDPAHMSQVVEPFFTTKPAGQGTGLGLSQVYGFVKQSGGHLAIYSEPGLGTTIKIYLPRTRAEVSTQQAGTAQTVVETGNGETILVVEDEHMVRAHARQTLEDAGYRVVEAADGAQALALLQREPSVALLFTDVVLGGGMTGRDVADAALSIRPGMPVLFTTGYTRNAIIHDGKLDDGVAFIGKPYTTEEMLRKVRQTLAVVR